MPSATDSTTKDDKESCRRVLYQWVNEPNPRQPVTWGTLHQALQEADLKYPANEVKLALDEGALA